MESRKRKLPARAAARVEQVSKKGRTATPPEHRSATPIAAPTPVPEEEEQPQKPPPPPLPKSVQPGKPLPTVEDAQPEDLPVKDYQSIQESGVLSESLSRSRQRWISEGLFEKYWSKPTKKRGVVHEEPNNPSKDSMTKVGQVTITLEPHIFEATMYAVKDPKPPAPQPVFRPILQYGPPNGIMPPPPVSVPTASALTASPAASQPQTQTQTPVLAPAQPQPSPAPQDAPKAVPSAAAAAAPPKPVASPRGMESVLSPNPTAPVPTTRPSSIPPLSAPLAPQSSQPPTTTTGPAPPPSYPASLPNRSPAPAMSAPAPIVGSGSAAPAPATQAQPPGTDPIIVTLAEKATSDPALRDLMKRVAQGQAPKDELERFQAIIDQITAESKRKGTLQGPSADRLLVDGRTVRYFADEVKMILDIVLTSDPKQSSASLRPPGGSDPLVVSLVKTALDDAKTRDIVKRIAGNKPQFSDATDLKDILDRLKVQLLKERELVQKAQSPAPGTSKANGVSNVQHNSSTHTLAQAHQPPPQQALRSKGPPPPVKPDVSAVVFEFAGGTGDRYLFPKFSILELTHGARGQEALASFLIVRKGSTSEYGGNPSQDYYQPVTIRLSSNVGKNLEYLSRVVAPPDEVKRYMDDIMDNMTRAEYILLAMRLPRGDKDSKEEGQGAEKDKIEESNGAALEAEDPWRRSGPTSFTWKAEKGIKQAPVKLLSSKASSKRIISEDEEYQNFITTVSRKETEEEA